MSRLPARTPVLLSWAAIAAYALHLGFRYEALPARVASHYDASGVADGFQAKSAFAITSLVTVVLMAALFTVAPALMRKTPNGFFNLPNRDHWLAPERREATLARLALFNDWIGFGTVSMTCALFVLIVRANLQDQRLGVSAWVLIGALLAFVLAQGVALVRGFLRLD